MHESPAVGTSCPVFCYRYMPPLKSPYCSLRYVTSKRILNQACLPTRMNHIQVGTLSIGSIQRMILRMKMYKWRPRKLEYICNLPPSLYYTASMHSTHFSTHIIWTCIFILVYYYVITFSGRDGWCNLWRGNTETISSHMFLLQLFLQLDILTLCPLILEIMWRRWRWWVSCITTVTEDQLS